MKELCKKVVEVRKKSDKIMAVMLVFEVEVIRVICAYAPRVRRSECEKNQLYNDITNEWDLQNPGEVVLGMGTLTHMLGNGLVVLRMCSVVWKWRKKC